MRYQEAHARPGAIENRRGSALTGNQLSGQSGLTNLAGTQQRYHRVAGEQAANRLQVSRPLDHRVMLP